MAGTVSRWRTTYRPGRWWLLAGPAALVVLPNEVSDEEHLISSLWEEVLASASVADLMTILTARGVAAWPALAVLFWSGQEMRSIVRGPVAITDDTGASVADGSGVQTWSELGLSASIGCISGCLRPSANRRWPPLGPIPTGRRCRWWSESRGCPRLWSRRHPRPSYGRHRWILRMLATQMMVSPIRRRGRPRPLLLSPTRPSPQMTQSGNSTGRPPNRTPSRPAPCQKSFPCWPYPPRGSQAG